MPRGDKAWRMGYTQGDRSFHYPQHGQRNDNRRLL